MSLSAPYRCHGFPFENLDELLCSWYSWYSSLRMGRSLVKFVGFCEGCGQNGDRVSKNDDSCYICISWLKSSLS